MSTIVCSTCKKEFEASDEPYMPFCSKRCQLIDLGRWLDEAPSVPWVGSHEEGDGEEYAG
jgi:endogenous inhibitor of DNA gyrase (YacG/DUF329 family)